MQNQTIEAAGGVAPAKSPQGPAKVPMALRLIRLSFQTAGRVSPDLMSRWAYKLWFTTSPPRERPEEKEVLARATSLPLSYKGQDLAAFEWGDGDRCILLMHGWNGRSSQLTQFVDPLVERGFRVVAFDAPAHGRNPGKRTDIFEIVDVLEQVAEKRGPFAGFVAHSMGALSVGVGISRGISMQRGVCLAPATTRTALIGQFSSTTSLPDGVRGGLTRRVDEFLGDGFWEKGRLHVPVLLIHDRRDSEISYEESVELAITLPSAQLLTTDGLGHRRILRDPSVVPPTVKFLTETR